MIDLGLTSLYHKNLDFEDFLHVSCTLQLPVTIWVARSHNERAAAAAAAGGNVIPGAHM